MRNRKKHMKLPNGFGSIKCLSGNRRKPYAVYPPVTEWTPTGPVTPPALAYTETWEEGYELLTAYNMEKAGKIKINRSVSLNAHQHSPKSINNSLTKNFTTHQKIFQKKRLPQPEQPTKTVLPSTIYPSEIYATMTSSRL